MNSADVEKLDFDQFYQNSTSAGAKYQERSGVKEEGGPCGLGDPNDMSLSKHEKEQLIPQRVFDTVSRYHCKEVRYNVATLKYIYNFISIMSIISVKCMMLAVRTTR